jgi:hypothetical protein
MFIGIGAQQLGPQQFGGIRFVGLTRTRLAEGHQSPVVILRVLDECLTELAAIFEALRGGSSMACLEERWNNETGQQPDHREHNYQFHHGKSMART